MHKALLGLLLCLLLLTSCTDSADTLSAQAAPDIQVSQSPTRSPATDLQGATLAGERYIFLPDDAHLREVRWSLDGTLYNVESSRPWDFQPHSGRVPAPWRTTDAANGEHTISATLNYRRGDQTWSRVVQATFTLANGPSAPDPGARRTLLFSDEFDGDALDTEKWATCYPWTNPDGCYNRTTGEEQVYRPGNVSVSGGTLKLTAKREQVGKRPYSSGMIASYPRGDGDGFAHTYGYIEARIKMPKGKGMWPAFWTLPWPVAWPPEIDIVEVIGDAPNTAEFHVHYGTSTRRLRYGRSYTGSDLSESFHVYGVEWQPGSLVWYLDGVERARFTSAQVPDRPMYLLLNLAVGGDWPGSPDADTPFPGVMEVDYVRVYNRR